MALLDVGNEIFGWLAFDKLRVNGSTGDCWFQGLFLGSTFQQSLNFFAPGTGFTEDCFSMDQRRGDGFRIISSAVCSLCMLFLI